MKYFKERNRSTPTFHPIHFGVMPKEKKEIKNQPQDEKTLTAAVSIEQDKRQKKNTLFSCS
jgi:hypothetical protein